MTQHMATPETYIKADLPLLGPHHLSHSHRHHLRLHRVPSGSEEEGDEELDPRIQVELEKLNRASEDINRLEMELDDARTAFRQVLSESTQSLNALSRKLGSCVDKARPYYDARMRLKEAHLESQKAVLRFERSRRMHEAAREMVQLAEEGYKRREQDLDPTWQEMLNHATLKVNDAEKETLESAQHHHAITLIFKRREEEVHHLQKDLKKVIAKSRPYFDMKEKFHQLLENHKRCVSRLENEVGSAKSLYSQTLHNLEAISDSIHRHRLEQKLKLQLGVREAGVGAESPSPSPTCGKGTTVEGSLSPHGVYSEVNTDSTGTGQTCGSSKTSGDMGQLMRSAGTMSCDPVCNTNRFINRDGHFEDSQPNAAGLNAVSPDPQNTPCLSRYPQKCLPESGCESRHRACLGLNNCKIDGLPERIASGYAGEGSCGNSQSTLRLSQACRCPDVVCQHSPISVSPGGDSSVSQSSEQDSVEHSADQAHQDTFSQEQNCVSSQGVTDTPMASLNMSSWQPSMLPISAEDPSNLSMSSQNCSTLSLSSQGISNLPSQSPSQLSAELTANNLHGVINRDTMLPSFMQNRVTPARPSAHLHQRAPPPTDNGAASSPTEHPDPSLRTNRSQSLPIASSAGRKSSQYNITCLGSTPEEYSALSASSGHHCKASKLQGIILQVDTAGILSVRPSVHQRADLHLEKGPKVIISTHHPTLGVYIEKPPQPCYSESL